MTKPDGTVVSFQYDRNGQRVRKIVTKNGASETTSYIMVGGRIIHITNPEMAFHFYYDGQGRPSVFKYNGGWYSYLYNLQGDVIAILDSAGSIVVEYKYDAWGATLAKTGSMAGTLAVHNPFRYRGYVFDLDTGLYYLKSRYYNPKWGRFINADEILGQTGEVLSHNLFAYCSSNPIERKDDTGFFWNTVIDAVAGAIVGGISAAITGGSIKAGITGGAISGAITGAAVDLIICIGVTGVVALAAASTIGGIGGGLASYVNQRMNGVEADDIDWGIIVFDGMFGAIGGALSLGMAGVGSKACSTVRQILTQSGKKIAKQATEDFAASAVISTFAWLGAARMDMLRDQEAVAVARS